MKIYVGVTDRDWYYQLSSDSAEEVNFWNPGGTSFKALDENELFLFKLHYPENRIVGGGYFVKFSLLPPFLAWNAFERKNGVSSFNELLIRIEKYRKRNKIDSNNQIGCTILTDTFWFNESDWIDVPEWSPSIVKGKRYSTETDAGQYLLKSVGERLHKSEAYHFINNNRFTETLTKHRIGQGAFRVAVTDAYQRRCAITGEKTLPVLEAAHIVPFSKEGPHVVSNGILLKSDFHTLFDDGYITLTKDYRVEVSQRLHDDFGNGKDYYKYHGQKVLILPPQGELRPNQKYIEWHNENVYLG